MNASLLARALTALEPFACDDGTRFHLCSFQYVDTKETLTLRATDGHKAIEIVLVKELPKGVKGAEQGTLNTGIVSREFFKRLVTLIKPVNKSAPDFGIISFADLLEHHRIPLVEAIYPPFDHLMPKRRAHGEKATLSNVGIDPEYLGDACKALKTLKIGTMEIQQGGDLDPILLMGTLSGEADVRILIMPMRI